MSSVRDQAKALLSERLNCQIRNTKQGTCFDWGIFRRGKEVELARFKVHPTSFHDKTIKREGFGLSKSEMDEISTHRVAKSRKVGYWMQFNLYVWCSSGIYSMSLPCEGATLEGDKMIVPLNFFVKLLSDGVPK